MRMTLTAVYEPVEGGWTQARIRELPAVITAGPTPEEAKELLLDALREYLLSLGGSAEGTSTPGPFREERLEILLNA
jgi:predicted RNase H-like HicB family nuclease